MTTYLKDPNALLDYAEDWTGWLAAGETITSYTATLTVPAGVTIDHSLQSGGIITVWLSGGTLDARATVTCHITTSAGRQDDRSFNVLLVQR